MRKHLIAAILLCVVLAACVYDNHAHEYAPQGSQSEADYAAAPGGMQAALTFAGEFGLGYLLRNETGARLYFNDDFRVESRSLTNLHNRAGVQFVDPGDTVSINVNWSDSRPTGLYNFEQDFFLDADLTQVYATLELVFDIIGWYYFTDNAPPIPAELQARRDERVREHLQFLVAGGTSDIIVLTGEVAVSRTEIALEIVNLSPHPFIYGLDHSLLVYDGGWRNAPVTFDGDWAIPLIGFSLAGGQVSDYRFNFEWLHGHLADGRYMLMRHHIEDHGRAGAPRTQETLLVEFVIDEHTPASLGDAVSAAIDVRVSTSEITPSGLQLEITNNASRPLSYSSPSLLQRYMYGTWENIYELAPPVHYSTPIPANEVVVISESWAQRFGALPPGRYQMFAHFSHADGAARGVLVVHEFDISQQAHDEYTGEAPPNPMFVQNIIPADVAVTPTGMVIRWENVSDRVFYTPSTHTWIESYSPDTGRGVDRLHESFGSTFDGPYARLRSVTVELSGGGAMTFDTTAVHPGQHVYQRINWHRLPAGQYIIFLPHFSPDAPGFMYWITPWERFMLAFSIED